jgi:hypothetical protein
MDAMGRRAEALKPGSFFITFTKGLSSPHFEILERKRYKMSWGPATVYIHRRLQADGTSVGGDPLKDVPDDDSYDSPDDEVSRGHGLTCGVPMWDSPSFFCGVLGFRRIELRRGRGGGRGGRCGGEQRGGRR